MCDTRSWCRLALCVLVLSPSLVRAATPAQKCEQEAGKALQRCVQKAGKLHRACYQQTGSACVDADPGLVAEFDRIGEKILRKCPDQATVQAAGYGPLLTPAGLVDRIAIGCTTAVASLAARSYGGPHGAVRAAASATDQTCLDGAWKEGQNLLRDAFRRQSSCIRKVGLGRPCDTGELATKLADRESKAATKIAGRCPTPLDALIAVDATAFAARAGAQARCLVATAHGVTTPLTLDCGPRPAVPVPTRGVDTQVVLPFATWGSRCGDGSDYKIWIHPAPLGSPIGKVVVFAQGGGSCVDGPDCASKSPSLFNANDQMPTNGILSSTDASNPFRDWTKVFLPYCTQDVHTGGGITNVFPEITVHRYGAVNVRTALGYVRDMVWTSMDAEDAEGHRPDRLVVLFSGSSAGGIGVQFNYHYILDDLGWVHSTLLSDSALGVDNGAGATQAVADLIFGATTPGWGGLSMAPPYCHDRACGEMWNHLVLATAARLGAQPEQQYLSLSNQADQVQKSTLQFATMADFINAVRTKYCEQQGTPFVHSFLSATTTPTHGHIFKSDFNTVSAAGVLMRDWVATAIMAPGSLTDAVSEGTLVTDYPSVVPFACIVAP